MSGESAFAAWFQALVHKFVTTVTTPPTVHEVAVYVMITVVFVIVLVLFHYSEIQRRVRTMSRCYQEKLKVTTGGKYVVLASTKSGKPVYKVSYDFTAKQFDIESACTSGNNIITVPSIRVYDLKTNKVATIKNYIFKCDQGFDQQELEKLYYSGYPDLVRFMNDRSEDPDLSFFQTMK